MNPRIMLIDEQPLFRRGVAHLLRDAGTIVGEAADVDGAMQQVGQLLPDLVLLDLRLDPGDRSAMIVMFAVIAKLLEAHPQVRIILLTMHDEPVVQRAAQAAGAHGYVTKRATDNMLLAAVHAVWVGEHYFERRWQAMDTTPSLATREREIVRGIALGYTNREIADRLDLSIKSVESYRARVMQKLGLSSRADLVCYAFRSGLFWAGAGLEPCANSS